jgi:hypothetical protein
MQNKPRSRTDVQWVISSVSLAVTLGLWGLFVGHEKRGAAVAGQVAFTPPQTDQVVVTQPQLLAPGQVLLFGGTAPQTQQTVVTQTSGQNRSRRGGGGGPVTSTHSSRP